MERTRDSDSTWHSSDSDYDVFSDEHLQGMRSRRADKRRLKYLRRKKEGILAARTILQKCKEHHTPDIDLFWPELRQTLLKFTDCEPECKPIRFSQTLRDGDITELAEAVLQVTGAPDWDTLNAELDTLIALTAICVDPRKQGRIPPSSYSPFLQRRCQELASITADDLDSMPIMGEGRRDEHHLQPAHHAMDNAEDNAVDQQHRGPVTPVPSLVRAAESAVAPGVLPAVGDSASSVSTPTTTGKSSSAKALTVRKAGSNPTTRPKRDPAMSSVLHQMSRSEVKSLATLAESQQNAAKAAARQSIRKASNPTTKTSTARSRVPTSLTKPSTATHGCVEAVDPRSSIEAFLSWEKATFDTKYYNRSRDLQIVLSISQNFTVDTTNNADLSAWKAWLDKASNLAAECWRDEGDGQCLVNGYSCAVVIRYCRMRKTLPTSPLAVLDTLSKWKGGLKPHILHTSDPRLDGMAKLFQFPIPMEADRTCFLNFLRVLVNTRNKKLHPLKGES